MKFLKAIILVIVIILIIVYCLFLRGLVPCTLTNLTDNLLTTLSATTLSIIVGIFVFERQNATNAESDKKKFMLTVRAESKDIESILGSSEGMQINLPDGTALSAVITYISPLAHESAGQSGLFSSLTTENLFHISRKIRMYNLKVTHLMGLIQSSNTSFIEHAVNNINETKDAILSDCTLIQSQLEQA